MKIKLSPSDLKDFALYGIKALQDVALQAIERGDAKTVSTVLGQIDDLFDQFLERPTKDRLDILDLRVAREDAGHDRDRLVDLRDRVKVTKNAADAISLAKNQVLFGLAARSLDFVFGERDDRVVRVKIANEALSRLPSNLQKLTDMFQSATDRKTGDFWGWGWFDVVPDGKVHTMDTTTRPNRAYVVKALQIIDGVNIAPPQQPNLRVDEHSIFQFDANNGLGIPGAIRAVSQSRVHYAGLLADTAFDNMNAFIALLETAKANAEAARERRLADTPMSEDKLRQFKDNILSSLKDDARLRKVFIALGAFVDKTGESGPEGVKSWGYNQIDEKGAFIDDWYVSYSSWGESYGRGIAQGADQAAFEAIVDGARKAPHIAKANIISVIEQQISERRLRNPIVFQSLAASFEYQEIRSRDVFVPSWRDDCPKTNVLNIDGFIGVLKYADLTVPVIDIHSTNKSYRNRILIANLPKLARWSQYNPAPTPADNSFIRDGLFMKVTDLSADEAARQRLLDEKPDWLALKGDRDAQVDFLKTHVVVRVLHRLKVETIDPDAGVSFKVRRTREEIEIEGD